MYENNEENEDNDIQRAIVASNKDEDERKARSVNKSSLIKLDNKFIRLKFNY